MRRIPVIVASLFFLTLMATAQAGTSGGIGITQGRYGAAQVFDVQRSPALPLAGQAFTASAFAAPVQGGFPLTRYTIAPDQYVSLVKVSDTPCRYGISLFDGNGLVRVIHASGIVYGLGDEGFLHVSEPDDFGTFVSNGNTGYVYGGSLSYTPTTGEATCPQADTYAANPTPIAAYSVGGPVNGLTGSGLVLQNNGGDDLAVSTSSYTFGRLLLSGDIYSVTVASQPTLPPQTCTVSPGIGLGIVGSANVNVVAVNCINNFYYVRFRVEGLQDGSRVPVSESSLAQGNYPNGDWVIERANGASYDIDIGSVPGHQCTVSAPDSGTLNGADSPLITISCDPDDYRVGGSVAVGAGIVGLAPGNTVRLRLDYQPPEPPPCSASAGPVACKVTAAGFEEKSFTANGDFSFDTLLNISDRLTVTTATGGNPTTPYPQTCTPGLGAVGKLPIGVTATLGAADFTLVKVDCAPAYYSVGGAVSGLAAGNSVVLRKSYGSGQFEDVEVTQNAAYTFPTLLADGSTYTVSVLTQPTDPNQTCSLQQVTHKDSLPGQGVISGSNVSFINFVCTTNTYQVGGTVSGLLPGYGVGLSANGGTTQTFGNGPYAFTVTDGEGASISVSQQPQGHACQVIDRGDSKSPGRNITTLDVVCTPGQYTVSGSVIGLLTGNSLSVALDYAPPASCLAPSADPEAKACKVGAAGTEGPITVSGNAFAFTTGLSIGDTYTARIATQPNTPAQACTISPQTIDKADGSSVSGTVSTGDIALQVTCAAPANFSIGGSISGLSGSGLVLQLNGGNDLAIAAGASSFTFPSPLVDGSPYTVSVRTQPGNPAQTCSVSSGSGSLAGANVNNVSITCSTSSFTVGGTVTGLAGSGLVLQLNGSGSLPVAANGSFVFPAIADGSSYAVSVLTQPTGPVQNCVVGSGSGTLAGANISNVAVTCSTSSFTVGGSVSGLAGSGLVLQLNGTANLPVASNGSFAFPAIADGSPYAVSVATQPTAPAQTCSVSNGNGTLAGANVSSVAVSCVTAVAPPGPPTNVQVTVSAGGATISWTPPANNGGAPITGYTVVAQPGGFSCTVSGNPPPTSCQISGLQPNQAYTFSVTAANSAGAGGAAVGGTGAIAPAVIPVDQPWALALLGLLMLLLGRRTLPSARPR